MSKIFTLIISGLFIWREITRPKLLTPKTTLAQYDPEMVNIGLEIEREHSNDPKVIETIVLNHLEENRRYYDNEIFKRELLKERQ